MPQASGVSWQAIESPSEVLQEQWDEGEDVLFEDSEITITVDWGDNQRGHLVSGLTILEPMAKTRGVDLHVLDLGSYVGTLQLALETKSGDSIATNEFQVERRKLGSDADLAEIEAYWSTLHLPEKPSVSRRIYNQSSGRPGEARPAQWAIMVRDMLRPLLTATRSIGQRPKHAAVVQRENIHSRNLKRPRVSPVLASLKGQRRIETARPRWQEDPGAQAMAARDARRVLKHIENLRALLEEVDDELAPEMDHLLTQLETRLLKIAAEGDPSQAHRARQAVLHDSRYRLLHRAGLLAKRGGGDIGEGDLKSFQPPTYRLYEEWCTWAMVEAIAPGSERKRIHQELRYPWDDRGVLLREEPVPIRLQIQYEMSILGWKHRPDLVLTLDTPTTVCILDVKYRGEGEGLTEVPSDAIAELHRYRDAYLLRHPSAQHREVWSAILHPAPAWSDSQWERSEAFEGALEEAYRVGAVPLSPSLREALDIYLAEVLPERALPSGEGMGSDRAG